MACVTKLYSVYLAVPKLHYFKEVQKLHQRCGDYVWLGPRDLSIADVDAIPVIHGGASQCSKGPWYSAASHVEGSSMHNTRDKKEHKERRRIWDHAFNAKALRKYEYRIDRHTHDLMKRLDELERKSVRISDWLNFYSFDVMGDVGFSRSFGILEKGTEDTVIKKLHASMIPLGMFRDIMWVVNLVLRVPMLQSDLKEFMAWISGVLRERKKITLAERDIFSWLIDPNEPDVPLHLNADIRLLVVAGSDTTASTLTWLIYELCKNPSEQKTLPAAVDEVAGVRGFLTCGDVSQCSTLTPLLDASIHETLRLHPVRVFASATDTCLRDARYFKEPLRFAPERWLDTDAGLIRDKRAFFPFSIGTYNCIGKNLAMMEMRAVLANVARRFDINTAEGEDFYAIENLTRDTFTLTMGNLDVLLRGRPVVHAIVQTQEWFIG